ncbi:hypothetical protein AGMMS50256_07330 [Betaproteobacteria bacterium]|nr:hypothetical protein AGMMS50256_07330 [Betaproteobacteria bacterium]
MIDNVRQSIRQVRMNADFPRYEKEQLKAHAAAAERQFSTARIEEDIRTIKEKASQAANGKFGKLLAALHQEGAILQHEIDRIQDTLDIFERDYRGTLDQLYIEKDELFQKKNSLLEENTRLFEEMQLLKQERSEKQESLDDAFHRLEYAKESIDDWYAKSERSTFFFGNAGRELPSHSFFGQSFGDLDGYKDDRGEAVADIGNFKDLIREIKDQQNENWERRQEIKSALDQVFMQINAVKEQIKATKADRSRMFEMKKEGFKPSALKKELSGKLACRADRIERINTLNNQCAAFVRESERQLGIKEREAQVVAMKAQKAVFLAEFDTLAKRDQRRAEHRKMWMG